jgi:hypothetical protein
LHEAALAVRVPPLPPYAGPAKFVEQGGGGLLTEPE